MKFTLSSSIIFLILILAAFSARWRWWVAARRPHHGSKMTLFIGLAFLAVLAWFSIGTMPAQAQSVTLVSNIEQATARYTASPVGWFSASNDRNWVQAQSFTTGSNARGYRITSMTIEVYKGDPDAALAIGIYTDSLGEPGEELYRLRGSVNGTGVIKFYAPRGADLDADTDYFLVLINDDGQHHYFVADGTDSDQEDAIPALGFSIGNSRLEKWVSESDPSFGWEEVPEALKMAANGFAVVTEDTIETESDELTSHFQDTPEAHDGQSSFKFALHFNQEVDVGYTDMRNHVLQISGGIVENVRRLEPPSNQSWEYRMRPNSDTDMTIVLPVTSDCAAVGAVCTEDSKQLLNGLTATVSGPGSGTVPTATVLTGWFENVPESHDGVTPFTVELNFSEDITGLSYKTVRDSLFTVTGGQVTGARRLNPPSNQSWAVTLEPTGESAVEISLPVRACVETNAVCIDGEPLAAAASATVPGGTSFTGTFGVSPAEHNGVTPFKVHFHLSTEPQGLSYKTVRDSLFTVTGGQVTGARRLNPPSNQSWEMTVDPAGAADVTMTVRATTACDTAPGVCTTGGQKLPGGEQLTVLWPAALSVEDAEVEEAENAELVFTVTLNKARFATTTVHYATSDGSAAAELDYTAQSGTLTFGPRVTRQTITVPVLDDMVDEDRETLTLTLSRPSENVRLADAIATGTITNSDPLQQAWLARFGRTVSTHVMDAVGERLRAPPEQASHVTVGGYRLPLEKRAPGDADSEADPLTDLVTGLAGLEPSSADADLWLDPRLGQPRRAGLPAVRLRDVLLRSSFRLTLGATDSAGSSPHLTAWGRVAGTQFDGRDGRLTLDGDVLTGTTGVDGTWDRWLAGVAVSHSRGDGSFAMAETPTGRGEIDQTLTSLHPYLRYAVTDRLDVWGLLGYGWGDLTLKPANAPSLETDTTFLMGSIGSRGILLPATETGGFELATRTDAMFTRTTSDAVASSAANGGNMAGADGDAHRVRLILEGSREVTWASGRRLTPSMEIGLRHDWGDAETGFGAEVGGRIRYTDPRLGLTVEGAVRGLLAHEDSDYDEWGFSGSIDYAPGKDGLGLLVRLGSAWGVTESGVQSLWNQQGASGLARNAAFDAAQRYQIELQYGLNGLNGHARWAPYIGMESGEGSSQMLRLGVTLASGDRLDMGLELGQRQIGADADLERAIQLRGTLRW